MSILITIIISAFGVVIACYSLYLKCRKPLKLKLRIDRTVDVYFRKEITFRYHLIVDVVRCSNPDLFEIVWISGCPYKKKNEKIDDFYLVFPSVPCPVSQNGHKRLLKEGDKFYIEIENENFLYFLSQNRKKFYIWIDVSGIRKRFYVKQKYIRRLRKNWIGWAGWKDITNFDLSTINRFDLNGVKRLKPHFNLPEPYRTAKKRMERIRKEDER